jgi:hypothetical protein
MSSVDGMDAGATPDWLNRLAGRLEAMPSRLRLLVDAVIGDLQHPTPVRVRLAYESLGADGGGTLWVWEDGQPGGGGFAVAADLEVDDAAQAVALADYLQEQFFPETEGAWGEARPECPGHSHPAMPSELDDDAWWVCPEDGHRISRIGELPHRQ